MPKYVCKYCGKSFRSKKDIREHRKEEHDGAKSKSVPIKFNYSSPGLKNFLRNKKSLLMLIVVLMFIGSTIGFAFLRGSDSETNYRYNRSMDTYPPTGIGLKAIPRVDKREIPPVISQKEIPEHVQVYLIAPTDKKRSLVLIQYNCPDCPGLVNNLTNIVREYNDMNSNWVYLAPYRSMNTTIALTTYRKIERMEKYNKTKIVDFICSNLGNTPLACNLNIGGTNSSGYENKSVK